MQPGSTDYQSKKTGKQKKKEIKTGKGTRIKDQKEKRMTKKKSAPEALRYINEVGNKAKKKTISINTEVNKPIVVNSDSNGVA